MERTSDARLKMPYRLLSLFSFALALVPKAPLPSAPQRPRAAVIQPEMRFRVCDLTGKRRNAKARTVTFSHTRNHKVQKVNLQWKRMWWEEGNRWVRMRISTKAIKTVAKYGLHKTAEKYGIDLAKFSI